MTCRRTMLVLLAALIPVVGCSPDWYERDADRQITGIVEKRKEETLGYKPQTEAKMNTSVQPTTRAYAKVPITAIPRKSIIPLQPVKEQPVNEPLGPKVPEPSDNNYDLVPEYYTAYSVSVDRMGPPAPGSLSIDLDLLASIEYGVTHSRPYMDQMEELYLSTLTVTLARHNFDVIPFANTTVGYAGNQGTGDQYVNTVPQRNNVDYQSALSVINRFGVSQNLPYGGQVKAEQLVAVTHALNDAADNGDDARTALTASIPLLKGAGLVNLESLINSERQLVYTVRAFEQYRRSFAVNIASQYFQLITQQQGIRNRRQSYQTFLGLNDRSTAMFAAGKIGFLEVQRARQNLLSSENDLINAINAYQTALDSFKISLGMPVEADLEIVPVELSIDVPELDNSVAASTALKFRLDLQTAKDQVDDARRGVDNAKNGLLPQANFNAGTAVGNYQNDGWYKYNSSNWGYGAGVTINWPVDQLSERNAYRQSLITLESSFRAYITAREQVISDVRQISRSIRLALVTVEIQKRSVELNQRRLDLASEKLTQGTGQVLDFTDAQSALLNAQDSYDRAKATLQTQVLQYLRDTGTLRLNPGAGELARAMDRSDVMKRDADWFTEMERKLRDVEK